MCYSRCPFEDYHGECRQYKSQGTPLSHCYVAKCVQCGSEDIDCGQIPGEELCFECIAKEGEE